MKPPWVFQVSVMKPAQSPSLEVVAAKCKGETLCKVQTWSVRSCEPFWAGKFKQDSKDTWLKMIQNDSITTQGSTVFFFFSDRTKIRPQLSHAVVQATLGLAFPSRSSSTMAWLPHKMAMCNGLNADGDSRWVLKKPTVSSTAKRLGLDASWFHCFFWRCAWSRCCRCCCCCCCCCRRCCCCFLIYKWCCWNWTFMLLLLFDHVVDETYWDKIQATLLFAVCCLVLIMFLIMKHLEAWLWFAASRFLCVVCCWLLFIVAVVDTEPLTNNSNKNMIVISGCL